MGCRKAERFHFAKLKSSCKLQHQVCQDAHIKCKKGLTARSICLSVKL
uniref:Uncharacterized protein n=1 Tax=Arundo donax TaxID=35708 RepID=A0A0A9B1I1_ARUDO